MSRAAVDRIAVIALNTFRESMRSKVLYSLFFFAVVLILASAFFGSVSIGDQVKVIKDFGLFSVSFLGVCYVVISGASLLHKELARKTVYNILGKAVSRWEFLFGKFLGLVMAALTMMLCMAAGLVLFVSFFDKGISIPFLVAFSFIALELILICASAIFFSAIVVTPLLIGLFTFSFFLAGRSVSLILYLVDQKFVEGFGASLLKGIYYILPHFDALNVTQQAVFDEVVAPSQ
ncbi:MAG: ABC transporter permease subunit, partial [Bdellovibrionales bacterium]|nr:ABC transporter permease subunit [Bdellovibrionales bacterium]